MTNNQYGQSERTPLVSDAFASSSVPLPPFYVDPSMMLHFPQFHRCQDMTLLSYVETPGMEHYYGSLYGLPAQPPCQYGNADGYYGPSYVRKRNERERQRVKCVNEGYARLRRHLPQEYTEKRLSKVQTLRAAIKYIGCLQEAVRWEKKEDSGGAVQQYERARNNRRCER
ncbi:hypothetical protein GDO78_018572 [Eleutherodactylus coqui]|uniref:BHLH domain-containing protein n=1 Tax=Eleutherodactylus coqui TaxID=57060 RepID=A0A8J6BDE2_ELECQ|nr:hypothetical protein GDO78_018572 [Eleutherodactylus coqui]